MNIDNQTVAIHFGFRDKNKFYYYMPSFDPEFRNKGVGMILLQSIIEHEKDNVQVFDFLRGNEPYKFTWTDKLTFNYDIWAVSKNKNNFLTKVFLNMFVLAKTVPFFRLLSQKI